MTNRTIAFGVTVLCALSLMSGCTAKHQTKAPVDYVNTYIGHVSHMLVPCYPTVSLPHSMLRVFPCRREYTTELVGGLPLLVTSHRSQAPLTIGFAGDVWPGFGWNNLFQGSGRTELPGDEVPRRGGEFFQRQVDACLEAGCRSIYISMFDEANEGTSIFKIAREVPAPKDGAVFVSEEYGVPSDRYLKIAGETARRLKADL